MASHWLIGSRPISLDTPRVMAIANITPDSFYAGSRFDPADPGALREALALLVAEGADILDIGGQSTRPGSGRVDEKVELSRTVPAIIAAREIAPSLPITVDTYNATVAREALAAGADAVNDISAGRLDPQLLDLVAETGCGYVLMHMQGTPDSMQTNPHYENVLGEITGFIWSRITLLAGLGVDRQRIAIDPGIGFGKRLEDNLALIREAASFHTLGQPLLYGLSRKSFIQQLAGTRSTQGAGGSGGEHDPGSPAGRLPGTLGATWRLLDQGVMLHRMHDVGAARQLFQTWLALRDNGVD